MKSLKSKHNEKCFSLLREFIENAGAEENRKGIAHLALNQLQKITAGSGSESPTNKNAAGGGTPGCDDRPRVP